MEGIELKEITAGYDKTTVLDSISLKIEVGEFLGIIGPNGAGKSTLLKVIAGTLSPCKGEVIINGKDINKYKKKELAQLQSVVPQQSLFTLPFKCIDVVLMGRFPYVKWFETTEDYEIAYEAMRLTDTYELKDKLIQEVSGGELQRVRIARAITQQASFLLLDEPTAHLDIHHEVRIFEILKNLNAHGMTVVITSHNINTVVAYAKRIAILHQGKMVKMGSPQEIIKKELIEQIYGIAVMIEENPITHTPIIIPINTEVSNKI